MNLRDKTKDFFAAEKRVKEFSRRFLKCFFAAEKRETRVLAEIFIYSINLCVTSFPPFSAAPFLTYFSSTLKSRNHFPLLQLYLTISPIHQLPFLQHRLVAATVPDS